jgi:hypothetical protein
VSENHFHIFAFLLLPLKLADQAIALLQLVIMTGWGRTSKGTAVGYLPLIPTLVFVHAHWLSGDLRRSALMVCVQATCMLRATVQCPLASLFTSDGESPLRRRLQTSLLFHHHILHRDHHQSGLSRDTTHVLVPLRGLAPDSLPARWKARTECMSSTCPLW